MGDTGGQMQHSDYIVFVDESGDHNLTSIDAVYPVFVLALCVMPFEAYNQHVAPAVRALKFRLFGHDAVVLHEHDIVKRKGPFARMPPTERSALLDGLTAIIEGADMTIISVAVDKVKLRAKYVRPVHPYNLAMMFALERLHGFMKARGQHERMTHVVCEARGQSEDKELELQFRRVCDGDNQKAQRFCFDVVFAHKQANSEGLQLADLIARPIGLRVIKPQQENRAWPVIEGKMLRGTWGVDGWGFKVFP